MTEPSAPERIAAASKQLTEETAQRLLAALDQTRITRPVYLIRSSQIASAIVGTVGLTLFIFGVEQATGDIPVLSNAYGSIGVGLALLLITGLLLQRLGGPVAIETRPPDDTPLE
jgi:hypothetical protein